MKYERMEWVLHRAHNPDGRNAVRLSVGGAQAAAVLVGSISHNAANRLRPGDINRLVLMAGHETAQVLWDHNYQAVTAEVATSFWSIYPPEPRTPDIGISGLKAIKAADFKGTFVAPNQNYNPA